MKRLTKRVGCGEAVPVAEGDICAPFIKAGLCKTGILIPFGPWERHCNDTCVLGTIIDKLALYEDTGLAPEEIVPVVRCKDCRCDGECSIQDAMNWTPRTEIGDYFCSYGERREGE